MKHTGRKVTGLAKTRFKTFRLTDQEIEALKNININLSHAIRYCIRIVCKLKVKDNPYNRNL